MASWMDEAEEVELKPSWMDEAEEVKQPVPVKSGLEAALANKPKSPKQGSLSDQAAAAAVEYLDSSSQVGLPNILAAQDAFLPSMPWQEDVKVPEGMSRIDFFLKQKEQYKQQQKALQEQNKLGTGAGFVASILTGPGLMKAAGMGVKGLAQGAQRAYPSLRGILTAAPMTIEQQAITSGANAGLSSLARDVEGLRDNPTETLRNAAIATGVGANIPYVARGVGSGINKAGEWFTRRAENTVPLALGISRSGMASVGPEAAKRANKVINEEKLISGGRDYDRQLENIDKFYDKQGNVIGEGIKDFDAAFSPAGNDRAYSIGQDLLDYGKLLDSKNLSNVPGSVARKRAMNIMSPGRNTPTPVAPGSIPGFKIDPMTGKRVPRDVALDLNYRQARDFANSMSDEVVQGLKPDAYSKVLLGVRNRVLDPFRKEAERVMPTTAKAMSEADRKLEAVNNYYDLLRGADASSGIPTAGPSRPRVAASQALTQGIVAPRGWSALNATLRDTGSGISTLSQKVAALTSTNPTALGALYPVLAEAMKRDLAKGNKNNEELKAAMFLHKDKLPSNQRLDELLEDRSRQ